LLRSWDADDLNLPNLLGMPPAGKLTVSCHGGSAVVVSMNDFMFHGRYLTFGDNRLPGLN
jgi:hypothetical protein